MIFKVVCKFHFYLWRWRNSLQQIKYKIMLSFSFSEYNETQTSISSALYTFNHCFGISPWCQIVNSNSLGVSSSSLISWHKHLELISRMRVHINPIILQELKVKVRISHLLFRVIIAAISFYFQYTAYIPLWKQY